MASSKWKSLNELKEINLNRTIIIWGASNWVERTLNSLPEDFKVEFIVDNNVNNQGIDYLNFKVKSPKILKTKKKTIYTYLYR